MVVGAGLLVQEEHLTAVRGDPSQHPFGGQQDWRAGIGKHESDAFCRIGRIDRKISAASVQHGEESGHHLGRALGEDAHPALGIDAHSAQEAGQEPGPPNQLGVGERAVLSCHGQGIGLFLRAPNHELMDTDAVRQRHRGAVPLHEDLAGLLLRQ